jgi:GntR family transcriptional repressor for pyruvate dehydrogenase complex
VAPRAFEEVIDQITYAIRSGCYPPGSRLPTLDSLSKAMRVSRPSVVEAVHVLSDAGVIKVRRGGAGGISVVSSVIPPAIVSLASTRRRPGTLVEVLEARRPIEMELALLATDRADDSEIVEMRKAVEMLEFTPPNTPEWAYASELFHYLIARAARSDLLASYLHEVLEQLLLLLGYPSPRFDPGAEIQTHRATLEALEARDKDAVLAAMDMHLANMEQVASRLIRRTRRARRVLATT